MTSVPSTAARDQAARRRVLQAGFAEHPGVVRGVLLDLAARKPASVTGKQRSAVEDVVHDHVVERHDQVCLGVVQQVLALEGAIDQKYRGVVPQPVSKAEPEYAECPLFVIGDIKQLEALHKLEKLREVLGVVCERDVGKTLLESCVNWHGASPVVVY